MPFEYFSTRSFDKPVSFEEAVIRGLAPDGGLYHPETASVPPAGFLSEWKDLSFEELAVNIMSLYVPESEIPKADLQKLVKASYSTFRTPEVTPVTDLGKVGKNPLYLLELFHGPTYAFKDVALQMLGNLFEYFLQRKNSGKTGADREFITVIGATSGDTGSAAIYGLRNKKDVNVFILYPTGRISPIQEQQMTSVLDENVHTISVPGTFDDCQDDVKALFADKVFNDEYHVGAVNSINWARILAQITYYFKAYFDVAKRTGDKEIEFVVPSGNFGDILAGYYAREMGLPIKLVIATNENDILYRFLNSGSYSKDAEVHATLSPAMDILVSSNFERFLWHAVYKTVGKQDGEATGKFLAQFMQDLKTNGKFTVQPEVLAEARSVFSAAHATDAETIAAIKTTYKDLKPGYVVDPHTAVGVHAALGLKLDSEIPLVVLSTAHPAKFSDAVTKALDGEEKFDFNRDVMPEQFKQMMKSETKKIFAKSASTDEIKKIVIDTLRS